MNEVGITGPVFEKTLENTTFQKLDLFRSSGWVRYKELTSITGRDGWGIQRPSERWEMHISLICREETVLKIKMYDNIGMNIEEIG
jgi:hypothetical protein